MLKALSQLVISTLLLSAFITPLVFEVLERFFDPVPWPFSRVFNRVAMFAAIFSIIVLRKHFHLSELKPLFNSVTWKKGLKIAFIASLVSSLCALVVLPVYVNSGEFYWVDRTLVYWLIRIPKLIVAAILISIIEETFFRGVLYQTKRKTWGVLLAAVVTSAVYSFVHFIKPLYSWEYPGYSVFIGFDYIYQLVESMWGPNVLPVIFGFFLIGLTLCAVVERTKSLYLCIGLHAGWVVADKMAKYFVEPGPAFPHALGIDRRYFLVGKPLVWLSVFLAYGIVLVIWSRFQSKKEAS